MLVDSKAAHTYLFWHSSKSQSCLQSGAYSKLTVSIVLIMHGACVHRVMLLILLR